MSIRNKLEKSAKTLSRFSGLIGGAVKLLFPFSNGNVYFNITDDAPLTLEIRDMAAKLVEGRTEPVTLELSGSVADFLEVLQGKTSFATSWVNGKLKVKGIRNNLMNALVMGMILGGV
jgi:putative sterol carrier protein